MAELENFKRRTEKEKGRSLRFFCQRPRVFRDILGLVDDFERFFQYVDNRRGRKLDDGFVQGVELIHKGLAEECWSKHGVETSERRPACRWTTISTRLL